MTYFNLACDLVSRDNGGGVYDDAILVPRDLR